MVLDIAFLSEKELQCNPAISYVVAVSSSYNRNDLSNPDYGNWVVRGALAGLKHCQREAPNEKLLLFLARLQNVH